MKDTYLTISETITGEYKDKGSKFIAYAYPVADRNSIKIHIDKLKKKHLKACHHCYAYRLGLEGKDYRANDDGEPSGTAGRPILGQIDSFGLSYVLIVVVRYYGGTNLGTSGLKKAYKSSSREALSQANIIEKIVEKPFDITYDYANTSNVMNYIKKVGFSIKNIDYKETTTVLTVSVRLNDIAEFKKKILKIESVKLEENLSILDK